MLKFYQLMKLFFGVMIGCLLTLAVFYEVTVRLQLDYFSQDKPDGVITVYQNMKKFIFYDPYYQSVVSKVNVSVENFQQNFMSMSDVLTDMSTNKEFLNALFILQVSKKSEELEQMINKNLVVNPVFLDFLIIDPAKAVIYKYGDSPFSAEYETLSNNQIIKPAEGTVAFIQDYEDAMLETKLNLVGVISTNGVQERLKSIGYSALFYMNNSLYKNSLTFPNVVNKMKSATHSRQKYSTGLSVVEFFPLNIQNVVVGILAVNYPARSLGSTFLILLKVLLGILLVLGWILFDRTMERSLVKASAWKKSIQQPKKQNNDIEFSKETEKSLDWFQHYVEGSEEKK